MFQGGGFGAGASSSFGSFNKPATSFGATPTVFGSAGSSLFGSAPQPASGGLFGSTTPAPAFGQPQTTTPSFGSFANNTSTGLFGNNQNASTSTGLFGSTNTSAFGQAKPAFGGFGTAQTTSLFGQQSTAQVQPQATNIFGQSSGASTTGLFGASGGFGTTMGASTNNGTGSVKFQAVTGTDSMVKNGVSQTISTRHHCITCMKEYESKSLEELRLEDYAANRKGPQQGVQPSGGLFGSAPQPSLFGAAANTSATGSGLFGSTENKPLFGNTNTSLGFGQASNVFGSTSSSLFGKPATSTPAFGTSTTTNTSTFPFNSTTSASPFGSNMAQVKPFGSTQPSLFGASTSQPTQGFGTPSTAFGSTSFGTPATQNTGLFSQNKSTFGASTTPFSFGQSATTSTGTSLFGAKPTNTFGSPFGTTTTPSAFGTTSTFGSTNQNSTLFGNTLKPATSTFNFGSTPATNTGLGGGSTLFGNNTNKPPSLFGGTGTSTGLFGTSPFGNTTNPTFGSTTNTGLGMGMPMGSFLGGNTFSTSNATQPAANQVNQHILLLTSMPFGDNPLFKNRLQAVTGKTEELLKPPPGVQKNLLNGRSFKVSNNIPSKIKMKPIGASTLTKVSLFEGLEDDPSYFQKMQMKPTIKRLNIQARSNRSPGPNQSPELPSPLLPLENLRSERNTPRFFTPLSSLTGDKTDTSPSDASKQNTSVTDESTPVSSKTPPTTDNNDGSNTVLMNTLNQSPENTMAELRGKQSSPVVTSPISNTSNDNKENVEQSSSSNSSESDIYEVVSSEEPHPAGVILRRVGYYTIPSMEELASLVDSEGHCFVENFTVGRFSYGNIYFPESFDVAGLNLDEIVHFRHKEVTVYPDDNVKPPLGEGLNRAAQVTLDRVWPMDKVTKTVISDPHQLANMDYELTLRNACAKNNTRFKDYRPHTGSWVFKVDHFSKYGLSDSDEEEAPVSDIKKLRLNSAPPQTFPPGPKDLGLKRGLDGAWAPPPQNTPATALLSLDEDDQDMDDELIKTPFDLDENYHPTQLSPTMTLAQRMGSSAHKVQLMKASFYTDEMDDFHQNGDFIDYRLGSLLQVEEFDQGPKLSKHFPTLRTQLTKYEETPSPSSYQPTDVDLQTSVLVPPSVEVPMVPPAPAVKPQHHTLRYPQGGVVCYTQSLAARPDIQARCAMDLALFKGRSFRTGWSRDNTLVHLTTTTMANLVEPSLPLSHLGEVLEGRLEADCSPAIVQRIRLLPGASASAGPQHEITFQETIEQHLEIALEHSLFSSEAAGRVAPRAGVEALHAHCTLAQISTEPRIIRPTPFNDTLCQVLELCVALWGNLVDLDPHEVVSSHHSVMQRRRAVSDWLVRVVELKVSQSITKDTPDPRKIFSLLTGHRVEEACINAGDHYATLLLSQLGGDNRMKLMMEQQLTQWVETQADQLIDTDRLKLMMLVAGRPVLQASDRFINICENLEWRRAFALHLWYICSPVASVTDALLRYDAAFCDDEQPYAAAPTPPYPEDLQWESSMGRPIHDVCYHLLKLFSSRAYPLAPLLNPATHTADPLDHRLSWLLLRTVEALGYSHVSSLCASNIHTMFAAQLEAQGLWTWAVFVLLHIPDAQARCRTVQEVLWRHVDLGTDPQQEAFLINRLHIPAPWVYQAKAMFATAHFQFNEAAEFLLRGEQWNEAHQIIIQHISAKAVINEKYEYLGSLLRRLAPHSQEISSWGQQGALLLDYMDVVRCVKELISQRDPSQLERLQPQLISLCSHIRLLPTPTTLHRLCQVEVAKRAVTSIRTLLILRRGGGGSQLGMSLSVLARLVSQLPLPEDYTKQELHELTSTMVASVAR